MVFSQTVKGYGLALMAVFFWSLNVLIAQRFATDITPIEFAFGRWSFALIILLPLGLRGIIQHWEYLKQHLIWIVGLALTGIVLDNTLIYLAAHTVDAVNLSLLNLLGPIFLFIISALFLHQRVGWGEVAGIGIALLGVMIIITGGHLMNIGQMPFVIGDFWMIINAMCFAGYSFLQFRRPAFLSQTSLLTLTVFVGVLILLPFFLYEEQELIHHHLTLTDLGVFLYLGIFNSVCAYLAWNNALSQIGSIQTGIIYYLQPVFSMIGAFLVLGTPITKAQIGGGLIVILGIIALNYFQKKGEINPPFKIK